MPEALKYQKAAKYKLVSPSVCRKRLLGNRSHATKRYLEARATLRANPDTLYRVFGTGEVPGGQSYL